MKRIVINIKQILTLCGNFNVFQETRELKYKYALNYSFINKSYIFKSLCNLYSMTKDLFCKPL